MSARYDIVVYGATGFAGVYVVKTIANISLFKGKTIAVAGRSEDKLRTTIEEIFRETGNEDVRKYPIIVADSSKEESLANMARQAKVIINCVGPYIVHGEAVVRAAINNGASHVDISGEPAFVERMEQKYGKMAKDKGVYIIGSCGFDCVPSDLGLDFLKRHFDGTLDYVETCFRVNRGPAGYTLNTGTLDSVLLGIKSIRDGGEAALHRSVMPESIPESGYKPSCRFPLTKFREPSLNAWAMPFPGGDKAVIERSQYYDFTVNGRRPVGVYTYFSIGSFIQSILLAMWLGIIGFFGLFGPTRRFISNHPEELSFGMFKKSGPTSQQINETSFHYCFFGTGWAQGESDTARPTKKVTAVCHGPDPGYVGTSAMICSVALALLDDRYKLPRDGGVFTTASALRDTRVYEYLRSMGVSFELLTKEKTDGTQLICLVADSFPDWKEVIGVAMSSRYDIVVYGATGFTGKYVLRTQATEPLFKGKTVAVAGRTEWKIRAALYEVAKATGNAEVKKWPIILADSSDDESLASMAKQAIVIINTVGPYILYGESVVRAAVENGASHVDISGEPAYLEKMELKYKETAKENGVYVVGACGWDSIPCDLGTDYLKRHFDGTLAYVETCMRMNIGPSGYAVNTGTYESILLGVKSIREGGEAALHRAVMPIPLPKVEHRLPFRFPLSGISEPALNAWVMPFLGSDKSIVERSQYYDYHTNEQRPVQIRTLFNLGSMFNMMLLAIWGGVFAFFALFEPTRNFLKAHPEECSFGMFKKAGPTKEQIEDASFDYFFFGTGWAEGQSADKETPSKKMTAVCHGPDPGYTATSACICSAALALLDDKEKLPKDGGVFTTASAFRDTRIYEYLDTMGVTFDLLSE